MKLLLLSDLHNEFFHGSYVPIKNPGVDVLILAGDILTAAHGPLEFLEHVSNEFPHVLYVMGNHEHYHGNISKTRKQIFDYINRINGSGLKNVHLLENSMWAPPSHNTKKSERILFWGTTLWTDMNKENPLSEYQIGKGLNDYRVIQIDGPEGPRKLWPSDTIALHKKAVAELKQFIENVRVINNTQSVRLVIISHMAPSRQSIHPKYKHDYHINGAYSSDLSQLIEQTPEIVLWCHGHTHDSFDYPVGSTRVLANPRGYPMNYQAPQHNQKKDPFQGLIYENPLFDVGKIIEI